jgi:hypothetical protein
MEGLRDWVGRPEAVRLGWSLGGGARMGIVSNCLTRARDVFSEAGNPRSCRAGDR